MYKVIAIFLAICLIFENIFAMEEQYFDAEGSFDPILNCKVQIAAFFQINYTPGENDSDLTTENCFENGMYKIKLTKKMTDGAANFGVDYYLGFQNIWNPDQILPKKEFCHKANRNDFESTSNPQPETDEEPTYDPEEEAKCLKDLELISDANHTALYELFYYFNLNKFGTSNKYGQLYMKHAIQKIILYKRDRGDPDEFCGSRDFDPDDASPPKHDPNYYDPNDDDEWLGERFDYATLEPK